MHFNVELDNGALWDAVDNVFINMTGGYYEFGINYMINNTMLDGWSFRVYPSTSNVGNHGIGVDHDWVQWTVEHYVYNKTYGDYQMRKKEILYSNYNGYDHTDSNHGYTNKTSVNWWIDLWFSNDNSSSIVASRLNPEYYGMYEQGNLFWFGYGKFRPMFGDIDLSMFFDNAYNNDAEITTVSGEVELVQFWTKVAKVTGSETYQMKNFKMKNKEFALNRMIGIDTPAHVETKVIDMPSTGFLSPLIKALTGLGAIIVDGILGLLMSISGVIDNVLTRLGLPPIFSIIINVLTSLFDILNLIFLHLSDIVTYIIDSIGHTLSTIFLVIPRYLYFVGMVANVFISYYTTIVSFFTGGWAGVSNIWVDYSLFEWIQLYLICIFPFTEIAKIMGSDDPQAKLISEIKSFVGFLTGISKIAEWFIALILEILRSIRNLLI